MSVLLLLATTARAADTPAAETSAPAPTTAANRLSASERAEGFTLLFDGRTGKGWHGHKQAGFPKKGWRIEAGVLEVLKSNGSGGGGDLVSDAQYDNFELRLQFRLTPGANSGVKYLINEAPARKSAVGFEYQILDDERHPDARMGRDGNRTLAGLYDLMAPAPDKVVRPIGAWNDLRLVVAGNHIEHWLNGKRTVAFERTSPALQALIAQSKYQSIPGFGQDSRGHILLQDHGDHVGFRSIRVRKISPTSPPAAR